MTLCQAEMVTKRSRYGREMTEDEIEQNRILVQVIIWLRNHIFYGKHNFEPVTSGEGTEGSLSHTMESMLSPEPLERHENTTGGLS